MRMSDDVPSPSNTAVRSAYTPQLQLKHHVMELRLPTVTNPAMSGLSQTKHSGNPAESTAPSSGSSGLPRLS